MIQDQPLKLKELTREQLNAVYNREIKRDFPPDERRPLFAIHRLQQAGRYDSLGLFAGQSVVSYAFFWRAKDSSLALMDYLGVVQAHKGQGLGSHMLTLVKERYGSMPILAEVEAPNAQDGAQREQQLRRLDFYRRAGFRETGFDGKLFGVHYRMLTSAPGERGAFLAGYESLYRENLPPVLYRKFVQVPYHGEEANPKGEHP